MNNYEIIYVEDEVLDSYLNYAVSVIIGRALPDVRDGLKPVHRRTLYAMKELKNYFNQPYKKSARIVGDIIGKYHPHGEIAIYDSIVRLAQSFVLRYPLIDGQGNFGSIDGDSPAAMRYTEIRLSEFSELMLSDLDFMTVDYISNYDNTEKYPIILPAKLPNILLNGSCGIAVGVATNIPSHNIIEVINACIAFLDNPFIEPEEFINFIFGPDFSTYGIIDGIEGIINYYKTGKGQILVKSKIFFEYLNNKTYIIITELPYQVNKFKLVQKIKLLIKDKKIFGISNIIDESDKNGIRISIEIDENYNENLILDNLYLLTQMQIVFNVNMVVLVNNIPKLINLRDVIDYFIEYRKEVVYRKIEFNLINLEKKNHILEGFVIILFSLDNIIDIIKNIDTLSNLKIYLENKQWCKSLYLNLNLDFLFNEKDFYFLSKMQIQSILDLKIINFLKIEKNNIYRSYFENLSIISNYKNILNNSVDILNLIKDEFCFLKEKFGDKRRTFINTLDVKSDYLNLFDKNFIFLLSKFGYIDFLFIKNNIDNLFFNLRKNDLIISALYCNSVGFIYFFSNIGKIYKCLLNNDFFIKISHENYLITKLLHTKKNEFIIKTYYVDSIISNNLIVIVTKKGYIKVLFLDKFKHIKKNGLFFIKNINDDIISDVKVVNDLDEIILFSNFGRCVKFSLKKFVFSNKTKKVSRCMPMLKDEFIISLIVLNKNCYILCFTENGFIKKIEINNQILLKKCEKVVIGIKLNEKTGKLVSVNNVLNNNCLLFILNNGKIKKLFTNDILFSDKIILGFRFIKLNKSEKLNCIINF